MWVSANLLKVMPLMFLAACLEQRAVERFNATVERVCVTASPGQTVDQQLSSHSQGCVLVATDQSLVAGLNEVGLEPGVYRTQATNLGFTQYRDEVIVAQYADRLAIMTPAAFHELAEAAGAVHEARLEDQQLREGLGLVIVGSLQAFAPAAPRQLTQDQIVLLRKAF